MRADDELLWLLLGGAVIIMATSETPEWGTGWHWPVPDMLTAEGRFPAVKTQEFSAKHRGNDIMLSARGTSYAGAPITMPGFYGVRHKKAADGVTSDTDKLGQSFAVKGLWVLAARAGKVWSVTPTNNGIMVVIDHGKPWATFYGHLETCRLANTSRGESGESVAAGEIIGTVGAGLNTDPAKGLVDAEHLRHLHFETWYKGAADHAVDPERAMQSWERSTWH